MFRPFTLMRPSSGQAKLTYRGVYKVIDCYRYMQKRMKNAISVLHSLLPITIAIY